MRSVSELSIQPRVAFFLPSAAQPITRLIPGSNGYQSGLETEISDCYCSKTLRGSQLGMQTRLDRAQARS